MFWLTCIRVQLLSMSIRQWYRDVYIETFLIYDYITLFICRILQRYTHIWTKLYLNLNSSLNLCFFDISFTPYQGLYKQHAYRQLLTFYKGWSIYLLIGLWFADSSKLSSLISFRYSNEFKLYHLVVYMPRFTTYQ